MKKFFTIIVMAFLLAACNQQQSKNTIKVGTIAGPETQLMEAAKEVAVKKYDLNIEIVQFNDYAMPNEALADGSIDANVFQHKPYLDQSIAARGYPLVSIGKTFIYPMAIYSNKFKKLSQLPDEATIAIPNDPSNEARALLLLQDAKLITLKANAGASATVTDIASNPNAFTFKEIDAAQLTRVLNDVDAAVINTNYAMLANLMPKRNGLFVEPASSPYANLIVVRSKDRNNEQLQELVKALHSQMVQQRAEILFKGQAIPAWK